MCHVLQPYAIDSGTRIFFLNTLLQTIVNSGSRLTKHISALIWFPPLGGMSSDRHTYVTSQPRRNWRGSVPQLNV